MTRFLITGGCGFVGSYLADLLLNRGDEVVVLDDLSTGSYENVAHLEGNPGFRLLVGSILDEDLTGETVHAADKVFHLASTVGVKLIMEQPVQTIEAIFQGTDVVLRYANQYRKPVLITSTSEVYGKSQEVPFREDGDRLCGPTDSHRWAYACAKALDEFLALAHWKQTRLPVVIARLFNTIGPRQTGEYGMVIPRLIRSALVGDPLEVHGDGQQTRCFAHVLDIVDGLARLLDCPNAYGQVVNLGSTEEITIEALARRTIELTGSSSTIRFCPYENVYGPGFEDMQRRVPAIDKAASLIEWSPTRDLNSILRDVIEFARNQSNAK